MIRRAIRRFLVGEGGKAGSALLEFTIFAPMLVVMSIYTTDFGLLLYKQMEVQNAAQAGVDWALANHLFNETDIRQAVNLATSNTATVSFCPPGASPCPATGQSKPWCGCPSTTGVAFSTYTLGQPCTPPGCSSPGLYVYVATQATYNSFIGYGLFSSATRTLAANATARIQ
jgi:hypothetical protein